MVTLTENKITVADTSSVTVLSEFSLSHFRKIIGMDTFFAISAKDFRGTNIQIARYQKFIRGARMAIDTLIAANKNLQDANSFSQNENTELRTANSECNKANTEYLTIIKSERKKGRRQKYIWGVGGFTLALAIEETARLLLRR